MQIKLKHLQNTPMTDLEGKAMFPAKNAVSGHQGHSKLF